MTQSRCIFYLLFIFFYSRHSFALSAGGAAEQGLLTAPAQNVKLIKIDGAALVMRRVVTATAEARGVCHHSDLCSCVWRPLVGDARMARNSSS